MSKSVHSIHVPHWKHTAKSVPIRMPAPEYVYIPMSMHIGSPAIPIVKAGDHVKIGQMIGDASGFVSSPVFASVSGVVKEITDYLLPNGSVCPMVVIRSDELQEMDENLSLPKITDYDSFIEAVRRSGVVGLGGAGFPTHVKLKVDPDRVEYILVNGAECEPFITADTHTMIDKVERLMYGVRSLRKYYPKARILVGIEDNKPHAILMMQRYTDRIDDCDVVSVPSSYPQGGEKTLIYNVLHRVVPEGKLPIDIGCIVINTTTLSSIGKYEQSGIPLVTKCVTIDGGAVRDPQNVIVPIGTRISDLVEYIGGLKEEPKKILMGGPMMGTALPDMDRPVLKTTNAVILLTEKEARLKAPGNCIHCGRCMDACPMNLMPTELEQAEIQKDVETLKKLHVNLCIECGSCAFVCPAKHNLVESHKLAKMLVREAGVK